MDKSLFRSGITLQYFRFKADEVAKAGKNFYIAAGVISELIKECNILLNNRHIEYARLYCMQKANLAEWLCNKRNVYSVERLSNECQKLIDNNPDFYNAYVLMGFINEHPHNRISDSVIAFERALLCIGEKRYASSIYYWLARRCEGFSTLQNKVEHYYHKAYNTVGKYRNVYKLAILAEHKGNWEEAVRYLQECIEYIKQRDPYLDMLEQEYYYKAYLRISYIYIYKANEYVKGISYAERALDYRNNILDNKRKYCLYAYKAYGDDAEQYIELMLRNMKEKIPYEYISKAYEKLNMWEQSNEYWNRAIEADCTL